MPITFKREPTSCRIIQVPVKPHVFKILTCLYGDTVKAHHNTVTGKAIFNLIGDVLQEELDFPQRPLKGIKVELNYRVARFYSRYGLYEVFELGSYFDSVTQLMLFQHIASFQRMGKSVPSAIDDFYEMYGIDEDDYGRDSVQRLWHFRKGMYQRNFNGLKD